MSSLELLACAMLILVSACLAASEIALFSLSRFQLRYLKENFRAVHRKIKFLLADPGGLLITILVLNEVINVALSSFIAEAIAKQETSLITEWTKIPRWAVDIFLGVFISTPILLIVCEVTPKVIASRMNQLIATLSAGPLVFIYNIFRPFRILLQSVIHTILPLHSSHEVGSNEPILKESDFLLMLEEGKKEGAIQENELELIRNVFALDNTPVGEIATPLSQVLSLPVHSTVKEALIAVRSQRYSRIPILSAGKKEVVGILYSKDLLRAKLQPNALSTPIVSLMRKPYFASSGMKLNALFRKFKQQKIHMAVVKNPLGEVIGVVTMNDILDSLFEDLFS